MSNLLKSIFINLWEVSIHYNPLLKHFINRVTHQPLTNFTCGGWPELHDSKPIYPVTKP